MFFKKQFNFVTKAFTFVLIGSFMFSNVLMMRVFARETKKDAAKISVLKKYTTDLTALARAGRLNPTSNLEREVNRLIKALASGDLRQPVILDEKGETQELIIEMLAARLVSENAPANLKTKRVLKLELDSLFSNGKDSADISQKISAIFTELAESKEDVILFVNELTNFVGTTQINNALTETLMQGKVKIIGGSLKAAYNEKINESAEVAALFNPLTIGENDGDDFDKNTRRKSQQNCFRGDNVSSDLREMMANDPTGSKRVDIIIQAKDAENAALRELVNEGKARLTTRIGTSDMMMSIYRSAQSTRSRKAEWLIICRSTARRGCCRITSATRPEQIKFAH